MKRNRRLTNFTADFIARNRKKSYNYTRNSERATKTRRMILTVYKKSSEEIEL